ncbi:MAG: sodium:solute symporter [Tannerella sp.]|jgi:Na+/proline symporter|nr:sodium:solute symporter [Tannerella sp.]
MNGTAIFGILLAYFGILFFIARITGKKHSGNDAFFLGNRKSPWYVVAVGMVGASLSGVSFVSVPGMVGSIDMTYMQMTLGFLMGYAVIAFVLLPLYYKLQVTSIYAYLEKRIGPRAYKTGAGFFLLSRTVLAAVRLYLAVFILQTYVFDAWHIPFALTAAVFLLMMWAYTHKSGVKTLVWTDLLQTCLLIAALVLIIVRVGEGLHLDFPGMVASVKQSPHFRMFVFDDWHTKQNFFKQFLGGCFITVAMTGIDQEMMQKNLSCRNLKEAQKNVGLCSLFFVPINFLFLCLGILLLNYASQNGIVLPAMSDDILPDLITGGYFGFAAIIFFMTGIIAVTFASADSALTGLTTSVCVDILNVSQYNERKARKIRLGVHLGISLAFILIMLIFKAINNTSIIDAIYTITSYTYGPLLGLFAYGILFKRRTGDRAAPYICILSPVICFAANTLLKAAVNYQFGYELLIVNALLTIAGLYCCRFGKTRVRLS